MVRDREVVVATLVEVGILSSFLFSPFHNKLRRMPHDGILLVIQFGYKNSEFLSSLVHLAFRVTSIA